MILRKKDLLERILLVKKDEERLVILSFFYFFSLLCAYFILRPIRDEMGIFNGAVNMQWLFTGTFLTMLVIVPLFGYLTKRFSISKVLFYSYSFFTLHIFIFYFLFSQFGVTKLSAIFFFIWLSVFNLFIVSLFWSFMVHIFSGDTSRRLFGIIAAGGSLGAITGPLISNYLSEKVTVNNLLLISASFMMFSIIIIRTIIRMKKVDAQKHNLITLRNGTFGNNILNGIKKTFSSKYLLGIVTFMLFYTSVSTFLYFEQAHIIEGNNLDSGSRIAYFSKVDFITNILAAFGQLFATNRLIKSLGVSIVLAIVPLCIGLGFIVVSQKLSLAAIAALLIFHRAGNFVLIRPSREILFTATSTEDKYRSKNFIDTAIYRGGDAFTGWVFTGLFSLGLGLSTIALIAAPIALLWSLNGFKLGRSLNKKEQNITSEQLSHEAE